MRLSYSHESWNCNQARRFPGSSVTGCMTPMDHWKVVDLEIGDTIIWRGEGMRICNDTEGMMLISPGMKGKVITRSENLLAHTARKAGMSVDGGPWVLVEFENGFRMVVDSRARVERVKEQPRVFAS